MRSGSFDQVSGERPSELRGKSHGIRVIAEIPWQKANVHICGQMAHNHMLKQ